MPRSMSRSDFGEPHRFNSFFMSASSSFALVISTAPVSWFGATGLPWMLVDHRTHRVVAHLHRVLGDHRVHLPASGAFTSGSVASKPTNFLRPSPLVSPACRSVSSVPSVLDSFGAEDPVGLAEHVQHVLALLLGRVHGGAGVLVRSEMTWMPGLAAIASMNPASRSSVLAEPSW